MFAFADQEREFQKALRAERKEGEARGIILGAVETMRDDGKSNGEIIARLMAKYDLSPA